MSNRDIAIDLIQTLPVDASLHDLAREIEFVAVVREGFEQMARGEGVPAEEVNQVILHRLQGNPVREILHRPYRIVYRLDPEKNCHVR